jgi:hypothetical protein
VLNSAGVARKMTVICDRLREGPRCNEAVAIGEGLRSAGGTRSRFVMFQVMVNYLDKEANQG